MTLPWTNSRFDQNAAHVVTGGGGGSVSIGNFQNAALLSGSATTTFSSLTFTTGVCVVGYSCSNDTSPLVSVTINGVTATTLIASGWFNMCYANVSAGTGSVVIVTTVPAVSCSMTMAMITGTAQTSPSAHDSIFTGSGTSGIPTAASPPLTIPSGGVGVAWILDLGGNGISPVTWHGTSSGTSDASALAGSVPNSSESCIAMSHLTGSASMTATGDISANLGGTATGMCFAWGP